MEIIQLNAAPKATKSHKATLGTGEDMYIHAINKNLSVHLP